MQNGPMQNGQASARRRKQRGAERRSESASSARAPNPSGQAEQPVVMEPQPICYQPTMQNGPMQNGLRKRREALVEHRRIIIENFLYRYLASVDSGVDFEAAEKLAAEKLITHKLDCRSLAA